MDNGQGGYKGECVSAVIRAMHDVYSVPYGTLYCSETGGARDLFEQFDGTIPRHFDRIANDPNNWEQFPNPGDLIVWGGYMGRYGHVGMVVSANPLRVWQQLGTPVFTSLEIRQYPNYNGVLGWLSPKAQPNNTQGGDMATNQFIDQVFRSRLRRPADEEAYRHYGSGQYSGAEFVMNDVFHSHEAGLVEAEIQAAFAAKGQLGQFQKVIDQKQSEIVSLQNQNAELQRRLTAAQQQGSQQPPNGSTNADELLKQIAADTAATRQKINVIFK